VADSYDFDSAHRAEPVIRAYLSRKHAENERICPMVALPSDVSRSDPAVKRRFERVLLGKVACFERDLPGAGDENGASRASAIAGLCIGGMIVARCVKNPELATLLRESALEGALTLGGLPIAPKTLAREPDTKRRARGIPRQARERT